MLCVNNLIGFGAGGAGVLTAAFVSSNSTGTDGTSATFTAQDIGAAAASRVVVVGVYGRRAGVGAFTCSITIGGNAATKAVEITNGTSAGGTAGVSIHYLAVPADTTADIVVTFSTTSVRFGIGVWSLTSTSGVMLGATATDIEGDPTATTISVGAGGAVIGFAAESSALSNTATWSGLTEDLDAVIETRTYTGAHLNSAGTASVSVSVDWANASVIDPALVAAAFRPT